MRKRKHHVSPRVREFSEKTAPEAHVQPLDSLMQKFNAQQDRKANFIPPDSLSGMDKIVELRVREWMLRMKETKALKTDASIEKRNNIPKS